MYIYIYIFEYNPTLRLKSNVYTWFEGRRRTKVNLDKYT